MRRSRRGQRGLRRSSRARAAITIRSLAESSPTIALYRPRSTVMILPITASSWLGGRSLVRGWILFCWDGSGRRIRPRSVRHGPWLVAGLIKIGVGISWLQHCFPHLWKIRHGLRCRGDVLNLYAFDGEPPQDGPPGSGHAVVCVAVYHAAVKGRRADNQPSAVSSASPPRGR